MATKSRSRAAKPVREVTILVNGQVVGTVPESSGLVAAAKHVAQEHGIRSFSLKVDGRKVIAPNANDLLTRRKTLELVTKESRG